MQYTLKKSLGQHFLKNELTCKAIVQAVLEHKPTHIVEVGPGGGAITKYFLLLKNIPFKAIEIDNEKVAYLTQKYPALKGNILAESILTTAMPYEQPFAVVGNFPYNISTEILFKLLTWRSHITSITGMFQKEVALRIAAPKGSKVYGVTSVLLQAYFSITYLFDVPPQDFTPPPKVMSGVIQLIPLTQVVPMSSPAKFTTLVKAAFNQRRKTLRNATKSLFAPEQLAHPTFELRAEQLSVADFAALTFLMH